jgi:hypothetical protein
MQPTPITGIERRLDLPDPGRCTECKLPKQPRRRLRSRLRRR